LSVNLAAATQASQGTVAAVVTTAVMVWALVLVVLEVRANRRGARCWQSGTAWTRRQGGTSTSDDAATQPACVQGSRPQVRSNSPPQSTSQLLLTDSAGAI
jgi:hypothetical protein